MRLQRAIHPPVPSGHPAVLIGSAVTALVTLVATFAEFAVDLLRMRTREGMAVARAKGKLRGRQPRLSAAQQTHLMKLHASGEHSIADLAELFSVSRPTVYRVFERRQPAGDPQVCGSGQR